MVLLAICMVDESCAFIGRSLSLPGGVLLSEKNDRTRGKAAVQMMASEGKKKKVLVLGGDGKSSPSV